MQDRLTLCWLLCMHGGDVLLLLHCMRAVLALWCRRVGRCHVQIFLVIFVAAVRLHNTLFMEGVVPV